MGMGMGMELGAYGTILNHVVGAGQAGFERSAGGGVVLTERPERPVPLRIHSAQERAKRLLGRGAKLTVAQIVEIATMATGGLTDTGDPYHREGLEAVLSSARVSELTHSGRRRVNDMAWNAMASRMQLVEHRRRHPERFGGPLRRPFLIMGMARTGTTLLHHLLSLDPAFHGPPMWEMQYPFPPEDGPDDRRELAWRYFEQYQARTGGSYNHIHYVEPDDPEECTKIQMGQFINGLFWASAPLHEYADWLGARGRDLLDDAYAEYRQFLEILQWQHPDQALALKAPGHTAALGPIDRIVPEAMLIHTVRHPISWVVSSNSLVYQGHRITARRIDLPRMVETNLVSMEQSWAQHRAERSAAGARIIDVHYDDLMADPVRAVRSIYDFHGVDWPEDHDQTLRRHLDDNPQHRHGAHRYSSADFGLTDEAIVERFADYIDFFGLADPGS